MKIASYHSGTCLVNLSIVVTYYLALFIRSQPECFRAFLVLLAMLFGLSGGQSKEQERQEFLYNELDEWQISHFLPPKHLLSTSAVL